MCSDQCSVYQDEDILDIEFSGPDLPYDSLSFLIQSTYWLADLDFEKIFLPVLEANVSVYFFIVCQKFEALTFPPARRTYYYVQLR